jgi:hypothetical protein
MMATEPASRNPKGINTDASMAILIVQWESGRNQRRMGYAGRGRQRRSGRTGEKPLGTEISLKEKSKKYFKLLGI